MEGQKQPEKLTADALRELMAKPHWRVYQAEDVEGWIVGNSDPRYPPGLAPGVQVTLLRRPHCTAEAWELLPTYWSGRRRDRLSVSQYFSPARLAEMQAEAEPAE